MQRSPRPSPLVPGAPGGCPVGASKGQVWTRHCAPAAPAFTQPSLPSQFLACATTSSCSIGSECCSLSSPTWARDKPWGGWGGSLGHRGVEGQVCTATLLRRACLHTAFPAISVRSRTGKGTFQSSFRHPIPLSLRSIRRTRDPLGPCQGLRCGSWRTHRATHHGLGVAWALWRNHHSKGATVRLFGCERSGVNPPPCSTRTCLRTAFTALSVRFRFTQRARVSQWALWQRVGGGAALALVGARQVDVVEDVCFLLRRVPSWQLPRSSSLSKPENVYVTRNSLPLYIAPTAVAVPKGEGRAHCKFRRLCHPHTHIYRGM